MLGGAMVSLETLLSKKEFSTPPWHPSALGMSSRGHRAPKKVWRMPFPLENKEKGMYHRSGKRGIHHGAADFGKDKQ